MKTKSVGNTALPKLVDSFGRKITYLRISITDRCNLRCNYCMPEEGITNIPHEQILSFEELVRVIKIFSELGIKKIRFTGGEPFLRKGFISFLKRVSNVQLLNSINITTNGILLYKNANEIEKLPIETINLSLDSLKKETFQKITRRNNLDDVIKSLNWLLQSNFKTKINCVVQKEYYKEQIKDLSELTLTNDIEVRFIEQMPFNGDGKHAGIERIKTLKILEDNFGELEKIPTKKGTAVNYKIKNAVGTIGIISGYERSFCHLCNRLRLTSDGMMKNCLYDDGILNLKNLLRGKLSDIEIKEKIVDAVNNKLKDGYEAEKKLKAFNSMASIGG